MRIDRFFWLLAASLILLACGQEIPVPQDEVNTYKVAVVMPRSQWDSEKLLVQGALATIDQAQEGLRQRVKLDLEWIYSCFLIKCSKFLLHYLRIIFVFFLKFFQLRL